MKNENIIEVLDGKLRTILQEVLESDYWRKFASKKATPEYRLSVMKSIMREIWKYQIEVNKSVFTAVGRLGQAIEEQGLIRAMISVQIEEVGHGTLALNDYFKLGGTKEEANQKPGVGSLALISVVQYLGNRCHPLCHLGYMYFFEKFTVMITEVISPYLSEANYPDDSLEFMRLHAMEDERHTAMLREVILECADKYPEASEEINYGFDCFRQVYPHPIWGMAGNIEF